MKQSLIILATFLCSLTFAQKTVRTVSFDFDDKTVPTQGTLRYEIANAASGDSIVIPSSLKKLTLEDEILIDKNININADGVTIQVETPSGSNFRVFNVGLDLPINMLINNAVLKGGNLTGKSNDAKDLPNCGGVILVNNYSSLTLLNSTVNGGLGNYAGGIYAAENTALYLSNCYFLSNEATTNNAGAVYNLGTMLVDGCLFEANKAALDGAAVTSNKTQTIIRNSVFYANESAISSAANNGGAYFNTGAAASTLATVDNCTFYDNVAVNNGSGAYTASGGAKAIFTNCTFYNNSNSGATGAGAIYLRNSTATLVNCTVSGNKTVAGGLAGGIHINTTKPKLNLVNTIVTHNYKGSTTADVVVSAGSATGTNNVVGASTGTTLENAINFSYIPESNLFAEYKTLDGNKIPVMKDNGGIMCRGEIIPTIALVEMSGETMSIAMEAAAPAVEGYVIPNKDQRGYTRNAQYPCVGAYELNATSAVKNTKADIEVAIYPNPVKDILRITTVENIAKIELHSVSGQLVNSYSAP
ncbi:hypothetical protein MASR2M117_25800 [Paludibacter sp.]